ncbi:MAG: hypothetical protein Q8O01_06455 [Candidatus Omnitrophota bacterium]|nr:hypothetical protein [Candidatus Omnitrophota bacterium]
MLILPYVWMVVKNRQQFGGCVVNKHFVIASPAKRDEAISLDYFALRARNENRL